MNGNEKIFVRSYNAYMTEDIYAKGEVGKSYLVWDSKDNPVNGRFDTIENALKAVCEANCFKFVPENCFNFGKEMPEEVGRFEISVMVDTNNCEATKSEIEEWKHGRRRLWVCQLSVYLGVVAERDLTFEEIAA